MEWEGISLTLLVRPQLAHRARDKKYRHHGRHDDHYRCSSADRHASQRTVAAVRAARKDARTILHYVTFLRHIVAVVAQIFRRAKTLRSDAT